MVTPRTGKLLKRIDAMLDDAIAGNFRARVYDESMLSKIEAKMARFLDGARLRREQIEAEQGRVRSLIGDISHQTKTPIANISLYTGLLGEQRLSDEQRRLSEQIAASADKLDFLIRSLVKLSRLESGMIKAEPKPSDVYALMEAVVSDFAGEAEKKGVALRALLPDAPLTAQCDPRWGAEALSNIVDNAVKYTPPGGSVTVSATAYELFVRIDVTDTGRGIREADLPRVFGRFWRAAESADSPGVGIGLYLAREMIAASGGYIKAASEYGKGSAFSVFLSKV
jgi:signal transduction histidine kinase